MIDGALLWSAMLRTYRVVRTSLGTIGSGSGLIPEKAKASWDSTLMLYASSSYFPQ